MYIETDSRYSAPSNMAVEHEVASLLHALVRIYKPLVCLETGCGEGHASWSIAAALLSNGAGHLYTCDTDPDLVREINDQADDFPITAVESTGAELLQAFKPDFVFLDSSGDRVEEAKLIPPGCVVLIHDWSRTQYHVIKALPGWELKMEFPNPRGLALFFTK